MRLLTTAVFVVSMLWARMASAGNPPANETTPAPATPKEELIAYSVRFEGTASQSPTLVLPRALPMDQAFKLVAEVPADVQQVVAYLTRSYDEGCQPERISLKEPRVALETKIVRRAPQEDLDDATAIKEVQITVGKLAEPWWAHCFEIQLIREKLAEELVSFRFGVLLDALQDAAQSGAISDVSIAEASIRAGLLEDTCADLERWNDRLACEQVLYHAASQLKQRLKLFDILQHLIELQVHARELAADATQLGINPALVPSLAQLKLLYGRDRYAPGDFQDRSKYREWRKYLIGKLSRELHNLGMLSTQIKSPLELPEGLRSLTSLQEKGLDAKIAEVPEQDLLEEYERFEGTLAANQARLRWQLFEVLRHEIKERQSNMAERLSQVTGKLTELAARKKRLQEDMVSQEQWVKEARAPKQELLANILKKVQRIQELELALLQAKKALEDEQAKSSPDPKVVLLLTQEHQKAQKNYTAAQPAQVEQEFTQVMASLEHLEKVALDVLNASADKLHVLESEAAAAEVGKAAYEGELKKLEILKGKTERLAGTAARYEQSVYLAMANVRGVRVQLSHAQAPARMARAPEHTERARGFFTADLGLAGLRHPYGATRGSRWAPISFFQLSFSLGYMDLDNGLGAAKSPAYSHTYVRDFFEDMGWELSQRLSLNLGLSLSLGEIQTPSGKLKGIFGGGGPLALVGCGFRVNEFLKLNAGGIAGTTRSDLPGTNPELKLFPYVGVSLDLPVYRWIRREFVDELPPVSGLLVKPVPAQTPKT